MIEEQGRSKNAVVTNLELINDVTINEKNPYIISYNYQVDENKISDRYTVFEPDKILHLKIGDTVRIKYIEKDSILTNYEQYYFPKPKILIYIGLLFLIAGLILFSILVIKVKQESR